MFCFLYSSRFAKSTAHPGNRTDRKGAGLLGPTKADWGQTWPSFALSWSYMAQLGHVPTQVGLNMRNLVLCGSICRRSWAQDRPTFYRVENARPLQLKLYQTDRSATCISRSLPRLPGLGAFGAGGFPSGFMCVQSAVTLQFASLSLLF